jgi:hypothetical protein
MFIAACTLAIGTFLSRKCELNQGEVLDLSPSTLWPEPIVIVDSECEKEMLYERSPVIVTVEYHIDKADVENFLSLMYQLGRMRRQYGATLGTYCKNWISRVFISNNLWISHGFTT